MAEKKKKMLRITQVRSGIGHKVQAKRTLEALGLKRMHQSVIHSDTPMIRGMILKVGFLVEVEEVS